jgi:hypothetical protein
VVDVSLVADELSLLPVELLLPPGEVAPPVAPALEPKYEFTL